MDHKPITQERVDRLSDDVTAMLELAQRIRSMKLKSGQLECPKCKGVVRFAVAHNGHSRGKCETPNCLAWIE